MAYAIVLLTKLSMANSLVSAQFPRLSLLSLVVCRLSFFFIVVDRLSFLFSPKTFYAVSFLDSFYCAVLRLTFTHDSLSPQSFLFPFSPVIFF